MLTAALGLVMARLGRQVFAIDLDPANALGMALGAGPGPAHGIGSGMIRGDDWAASALSTPEGLGYLPFGRLNMEERIRLDVRLTAEPDWLAREIGRMALPDDAIMLLDTPRRPSVLADAAGRAATRVVNVLTPSPQSYAGLGQPMPAVPCIHVLNGFDATSALHVDLRAIYVETLGRHFAPYVVHRDETVAEALAADRPVLDYLAASQAVRDLNALARWLLDGAGFPK